ncbi:hypothetical protein BJ742DRAFT_739467 [Cladochytrium replicatum]|nr:hypothetical protein BJ742DRAFT_739467 [Cladochytrium replicatum]
MDSFLLSPSAPSASSTSSSTYPAQSSAPTTASPRPNSSSWSVQMPLPVRSLPQLLHDNDPIPSPPETPMRSLAQGYSHQQRIHQSYPDSHQQHRQELGHLPPHQRHMQLPHEFHQLQNQPQQQQQEQHQYQPHSHHQQQYMMPIGVASYNGSISGTQEDAPLSRSESIDTLQRPSSGWQPHSAPEPDSSSWQQQRVSETDASLPRRHLPPSFTSQLDSPVYSHQNPNVHLHSNQHRSNPVEISSSLLQSNNYPPGLSPHLAHLQNRYPTPSPSATSSLTGVPTPSQHNAPPPQRMLSTHVSDLPVSEPIWSITSVPSFSHSQEGSMPNNLQDDSIGSNYSNDGMYGNHDSYGHIEDSQPNFASHTQNDGSGYASQPHQENSNGSGNAPFTPFGLFPVDSSSGPTPLDFNNPAPIHDQGGSLGSQPMWTPQPLHQGGYDEINDGYSHSQPQSRRPWNTGPGLMNPGVPPQSDRYDGQGYMQPANHMGPAQSRPQHSNHYDRQPFLPALPTGTGPAQNNFHGPPFSSPMPGSIGMVGNQNGMQPLSGSYSSAGAAGAASIPIDDGGNDDAKRRGKKRPGRPVNSSWSGRDDAVLAQAAAAAIASSGPGSTKIYRCPRPLCSKVYKNPNGLKYHLHHGQCELDPDSTVPVNSAGANSDQLSSQIFPPSSGSPDFASTPGGASPTVDDGSLASPSHIKIAHRPYFCKVTNCRSSSNGVRRYKNLNGLKYHARVSHPELDFTRHVKGCSFTNRAGSPGIATDRRRPRRAAAEIASAGMKPDGLGGVRCEEGDEEELDATPEDSSTGSPRPQQRSPYDSYGHPPTSQQQQQQSYDSYGASPTTQQQQHQSYEAYGASQQQPQQYGPPGAAPSPSMAQQHLPQLAQRGYGQQLPPMQQSPYLSNPLPPLHQQQPMQQQQPMMLPGHREMGQDGVFDEMRGGVINTGLNGPNPHGFSLKALGSSL